MPLGCWLACCLRPQPTPGEPRRPRCESERRRTRQNYTCIACIPCMAAASRCVTHLGDGGAVALLSKYRAVVIEVVDFQRPGVVVLRGWKMYTEMCCRPVSVWMATLTLWHPPSSRRRTWWSNTRCCRSEKTPRRRCWARADRKTQSCFWRWNVSTNWDWGSLKNLMRLITEGICVFTAEKHNGLCVCVRVVEHLSH